MGYRTAASQVGGVQGSGQQSSAIEVSHTARRRPVNQGHARSWSCSWKEAVGVNKRRESRGVWGGLIAAGAGIVGMVGMVGYGMGLRRNTCRDPANRRDHKKTPHRSTSTRRNGQTDRLRPADIAVYFGDQSFTGASFS